MRYTILTPVDTNLNLIVTEERPRSPATPSLSQHQEFIYQRDKHKYSHIILRKPPKHITRSLLSEIRWAISCLLWQDKRDRPLEMTFLPADCKDRYVTTEHLPKAGKRGEEREEKIEIRLLAAPLPSSINVDISVFYIMSECGFENVPLTLWFRSWAVENRFECVSCFFGCLGFPNQTWIDPDILYKWQACACAHVHTQIQKWIKDREIKTCNSHFHLVCLEFFHLVFIPRAKLCILFCNQLHFNLFGTLSPLLSVRRWVIAAALHPAKRGVSQLRGHYLGSYWTAIFTCGPEGGHVHSSQDQTQH